VRIKVPDMFQMPREPVAFVTWANVVHEEEFERGSILKEPIPSTRHTPWHYESTGEYWSVMFFGDPVWDSDGDNGDCPEDALRFADELARNASLWLAN